MISGYDGVDSRDPRGIGKDFVEPVVRSVTFITTALSILNEPEIGAHTK